MLLGLGRHIAHWKAPRQQSPAAGARPRGARHLLFLSHCVPNPPNKGEKIRAHHEIAHLCREYEVHLVCFARSPAELEDALSLRDRCASIYAEMLPYHATLLRAGAAFAAGASLTASFYGSRRLREHTRLLCGLPLSAALIYSSAMAQYAPARLPVLLDMVDVDSEKWLEYGRVRKPGLPYAMEGRRLRKLERRATARALCTVLSTGQERELLAHEFAPARAITVENGVDFAYFDPAAAPRPENLQGREYLVFVGAMSYYPNAEGARRFATGIFPQLRRRHPRLEFLIVGHRPGAAITELGELPGVTVTGSVCDVRPYLAAARAVVAPLRIARGIQNKVLEGLAMGKVVAASSAVCRTFGADLPRGVLRCDAAEEFERALALADMASVRGAARARFDWSANMAVLGDEIRRIVEPGRVPVSAATGV